MPEIPHLSCEDVHTPADSAGSDNPAGRQETGTDGAVLQLPASKEAGIWRCAGQVVDLRRMRIMGIVNVTPDSFSDGGLHAAADEAIAWGLQLLDDGADLLDIGGESTRPGFSPVSPEEEFARIEPVIRALAQEGALISVDTRHASVAKAALEAGAHIINDVSGFTDPAMADVVAASDCGLVCMWAGKDALNHKSGTVARDYYQRRELKADNSGSYSAARARVGRQIVGGIAQWLLTQAHMLEERGVAPERICLDPGIGFGTTFEMDLAIQREMRSLSRLGYPLLTALSRKRSMSVMSGVKPVLERDAAGLGAAFAAYTRGSRLLRTHEVAHVSQALRVAEASWGKTDEVPALVALGSNVGDSVQTLAAALEQLNMLPMTRVTAASAAYSSAPAYLEDQPVFANAVAEIATELHPLALLPLLNDIEQAHGRVRDQHNGPRTLDLDLLWMEGESHAGRLLRLPHPRMGERDFVLRPLEDILGGTEQVQKFCQREGINWTLVPQRVGQVSERLGEIWPRP